MPTKISNLLWRQVNKVTGPALSCISLLLMGAAKVSAAIEQASPDNDWTLNPYGIPVALLVLLAGLLLFRYSRNRLGIGWDKVEAPLQNQQTEGHNPPDGSRAHDSAALGERRPGSPEVTQVSDRPPDVEAPLFGAYRVDQEVNKLIAGKPHRTEVMASRATEDRRAIEALLIKALESSQTSEEGRERARTALEEYGFVARQSATILLGRDTWERCSAARVLGQIGSKSSFAFLIEALHDTDSAVRNQAVSSLGTLKMPTAIGFLLDISRRHSDISASLLADTLSQCSVESVYLEGLSAQPSLFDGTSATEQVERVDSFEDLPPGNEDSELTEILERLKTGDEVARTQAAQELALHPVQRSVEELRSLVLHDPDASVRSAAINSLGSIDHESVFAPVLIGLADKSREVQAAAARTLTGLHFDRADAYVRVMEMADQETLLHVAQACVTAGIVEQAVDRLASEDRRQAYEAFSLFSLLARANETEPILKVIRHHRDEQVRLCAVRVLNLFGLPEIAPALRDLVSESTLPEAVRTAALGVLYKIDQDQSPVDLNACDNEAVTLHNPH